MCGAKLSTVGLCAELVFGERVSLTMSNPTQYRSFRRRIHPGSLVHRLTSDINNQRGGERRGRQKNVSPTGTFVSCYTTAEMTPNHVQVVGQRCGCGGKNVADQFVWENFFSSKLPSLMKKKTNSRRQCRRCDWVWWHRWSWIECRWSVDRRLPATDGNTSNYYWSIEAINVFFYFRSRCLRFFHVFIS